MQRLGKTFLAAYAYDNLDIDFKQDVPVIERQGDTLVHLTTGTMLPLHPKVALADLNCSDELWKKYYRNPSFKASDAPSIAIYDIHNIHPEQQHPSGLTRRDRFNAWKFRSDLVNFGPEYFRKFLTKLGDPEPIDMIPCSQSSQVPLRTVDVSPSTPAGNAEALDDFFRQSGIGDGGLGREKVNNRVVLVFGDLLTGQHVRSLLESLSEETTPWRRLQFVVFVMGLFHLKMACADAIWRIFIQPKGSDIDSNALMQYISQIRPKETGKFKLKPGFRRMHEIIQHVGIVLRLDSWRIKASQQNASYSSLEDFAKSSPDWDTIVKLSEEVTKNEGKLAADLDQLRGCNDAERDKQRENNLLLAQYFLLYEEISYAMNHGDIGRVEDCFLPWMYIFMGCGKHKYAKEMRRYLENVHFHYPEGLR